MYTIHHPPPHLPHPAKTIYIFLLLAIKHNRDFPCHATHHDCHAQPTQPPQLSPTLSPLFHYPLLGVHASYFSTVNSFSPHPTNPSASKRTGNIYTLKKLMTRCTLRSRSKIASTERATQREDISTPLGSFRQKVSLLKLLYHIIEGP